MDSQTTLPRATPPPRPLCTLVSGIQTPSPDGRASFVRVRLDLSLCFSGESGMPWSLLILQTVMAPKRLNRTVEVLKKLEHL